MDIPFIAKAFKIPGASRLQIVVLSAQTDEVFHLKQNRREIV